ncbi:MAG: 1-acyl-sn-glycerol-3-phosphate acyltransferase, partial [Rhodobacteraceae bacterium]|nr:1-acyl-sn-glycerol-3-phosphate acyltransferase [Paracoccaceae bacterium]
MNSLAMWFQWLRSLIFIVQMYMVMTLMALVFIPWALIDRSASYTGIRYYSRWVRWSAAVLVALRSEIRGEIPTGDVLICAKHQSFFDILIMTSVLERPRFVMKKQLLLMPIVGYFARRIGCIAVDRGRKRHAINQLLSGAQDMEGQVGQLVIYPQGTRVKPGVQMPYKVGVAILYESLDCICVPVATNVGIYWPRAAILRKPGLAVLEFL